MSVFETVGEANANNLQDRMMLFGICLFIVLILYDLYQTYSRGAFWVPGDALVLSGLTIQLLGFLQAQKVSVKDKHRSSEALLESQVSIDFSRVILCVFVGYILPGMASPANGGCWSNVLALLISISTQIATEAYGIYNKKNVTPDRGWWFIASSAIMLLSIIVLVILLGFAAIWGRYTSDTVSRRIRCILPQNMNTAIEGNPLESWDKFQGEILKAWIACRVCQPEYVLARSIFSAAAGGTVTVCVTLLAAKVIVFRSVLNALLLISLQCVFIGIGWIVIFYRWLMAVLYFADFKQSMISSFILLVIVLTRFMQLLMILVGVFRYDFPSCNSLLNLTQVLQDRLFGSKSYLKCIAVIIIFPFLLFPLLFLVMCLIWAGYIIALTTVIPFLVIVVTCILLIVIVSIFFWLLLPLICRNKFIRYLCKVETAMTPEDEEFIKNKDVLTVAVMPGEDPATLWIANQRSYHKIKHMMNIAAEGGKRHQELFVALGSTSTQNKVQFLSFCQMRETYRQHFPLMVEPAWRMTALSLVTVIIQVGEFVAASDVENKNRVEFSLKIYKQAGDLMDFMDSPNNVHARDIFGISNMETFLIRYQANNLTENLENRYRLSKWGPSVNRGDAHMGMEASTNSRPDSATVETVVESMKKLFDAANKNLQQSSFGYFGSMEQVMPNYCMCQVCAFFLNRPYSNVNELLSCLVGLLVDIIEACLSQLPLFLVISCRKWAAEFDEEKIYKSIEIAGKAWAVMEEARKFRYNQIRLGALPVPNVQPSEIQPLPASNIQAAEMQALLPAPNIQALGMHPPLLASNVQALEIHPPLPTSNVQTSEIHPPLPTFNVQVSETQPLLPTPNVQASEIQTALPGTHVQVSEIQLHQL